MKESASATRRPAKIMGKALGITTRQKMVHRPAPMLSPDHTRIVGVARAP